MAKPSFPTPMAQPQNEAGAPNPLGPMVQKTNASMGSDQAPAGGTEQNAAASNSQSTPIVPLQMQMAGNPPLAQMQGIPGQAPMRPPMNSGRLHSWSGLLHMTRSNNKRMTFAASLVHGNLLGVELVLKAMANDTNNVLNISHRIPFEEIAKSERTIMSVLSLQPSMRAEFDRLLAEDYINYFREKMRAGSVKIDESHSLYVVPPLKVPAHENPNTHIYALNADIPVNCLIAVVCKIHAIAKVVEPVPKKAKTREEIEKEKDMAQVQTDKIVDLFSNPELIQLLSSQS